MNISSNSNHFPVIVLFVICKFAQKIIGTIHNNSFTIWQTSSFIIRISQIFSAAYVHTAIILQIKESE